MQRNRFAVLSTVFLLIVSCGNLTYRTDPREISVAHVHVTASMLASRTGDNIRVRFRVKNASQQLINVELNQSVLLTEEGYMATMENYHASGTTLLPGKSGDYEVTYIPINSVYTHQRIGWPGDLRDHYLFRVDFLCDASGMPIISTNFSFRLSPGVYRSLIASSGIQKNLHFFALNIDQGTFITNQTAYYLSNVAASHNANHKKTTADEAAADVNTPIFLVGDEIMINKVTVKAVAYRFHNKTSLYCSIVNHGDHPVLLQTDRLRLAWNGGEARPLDNSADLITWKRNLTPLNRLFDAKTIGIGQEDRAAFTFRFRVPARVSQFRLVRDFLVDSKKRPLIYTDIPYTITNSVYP